MIERFSVRSASALALAAVFSASIAAQTPALGDVAKKEAERRKSLPSAAKVYTNKDLPESARKPAPAAPAPGTQAPAEPADAAARQKADEDRKAGEPKGEQKDEAWWNARITTAREELRRNEMFAQALQSRINALTRDFTNAFNAPRQRQIGQQRSEALAELNRVLQDVEAGKKQIADIEEEARQAGVPPGWLR